MACEEIRSAHENLLITCKEYINNTLIIRNRDTMQHKAKLLLLSVTRLLALVDQMDINHLMKAFDQVINVLL